jgi:hypothetical protein
MACDFKPFLREKLTNKKVLSVTKQIIEAKLIYSICNEHTGKLPKIGWVSNETVKIYMVNICTQKNEEV